MHFLTGMLFQVGQNEGQLVRDRGQRTGAISTVAATRVGLPINGGVLEIGRQRVLKMGQQRHEFCCPQVGH